MAGLPPVGPEGILVPTRLTPPHVRLEWVSRPRLSDRLEEALHHRLTLLSAPPGFGKSVLVAQWLEKRERPVAWLSLDPFDREPETFVRYLVAAIEGASPVRFPQTGALLATRQAPPFRHLCDVLASELASVEDPLVVVLEDYHTVSSDEIHRLLERLVPTIPPALHLVLLTRLDPPLPLGHWRAQEWLLELRGQDLRFSLDEARSFFASGQAVSLTESTIERVLERTEGWIAGLSLLKLSLRDSKNPEERARAFSGTDHLVVDYLVDEVLDVQPQEIREFLAVTASLSRFCAPLADHLLGGGPSRPAAVETLARLEQDNMFLVPLQGEGWYRYHHLFQDLLLHHLPELSVPGRRAEIDRRAGAWFAREGLVGEALRHWIAAGELDVAARLVGEHLCEMTNEDSSRRLLSGWLSLFPPGAEHGRLPLLIARGYLKVANWDLPGIAEIVAEAEGLVHEASADGGAEGAESFQSDVCALRSFVLYWSGDAEGAMRAASGALDRLPRRGGGLARPLSLYHKAGGLALSGRRSEAVELLEDGVAQGATADQPRVGDLLFALGGVHLYAGDLESADAEVRRALAMHETVPIEDYWMGNLLYLGAAVAYERNRLDEAEEQLERVEAFRYRMSTRFYMDALAGRSLVARARGHREEAARHAAEARAFALEVQDPTSFRAAESLESRLALGGGGAVAATSAPPAADDATTFWIEVPSLTWAERLLEDASAEGLDAALTYIEQVLERVEAYHNARLAIPFSLLRAMALDARGERDAALEALETVVKRAEPLGLVRTFADRGPRLRALLEELAARVGRGGYLGTLLSACRANGSATLRPSPDAAQAGPAGRPGPHVDSWEMLSNREAQILDLLAERLSNKEIAERLNISPDTVKNHTVNIYGKLGVRGRRQAVAKGLADGILVPHPWYPPPA